MLQFWILKKRKWGYLKYKQKGTSKLSFTVRYIHRIYNIPIETKWRSSIFSRSQIELNVKKFYSNKKLKQDNDSEKNII